VSDDLSGAESEQTGNWKTGKSRIGSERKKKAKRGGGGGDPKVNRLKNTEKTDHLGGQVGGCKSPLWA